MLTIFTAANRKYEPFVLPFIASSLAHNPGAIIEIVIEDEARFRGENSNALAILSKRFGDRFVLTRGDFSRLPANSVRFTETPTRKADYVYIGDIDILVLEEIAPIHLKNMERTRLPYSNIKRPGRNALSGLHFSRWDAFYPHPAGTPRNRITVDEGYLYDLVVTRGLPLPAEDDTFRPLHGFHLSLNREPHLKKMAGAGRERRNMFHPT